MTVKTASLKQRSLQSWRDRGRSLPELAGAIVNLIGGPRFEGRNHLVSEDGEPIDPFEVEVRTAKGDSFKRHVVGIPINEMTPVQRRGTGRYPLAVSLSEDAMMANLAVLYRHHGGFAFDTPFQYTLSRIQLLKGELEGLNDAADPTGRRRAELEFRLLSLDEGLRARMEPDARPIRWTRYFFDARYRHLVSGPIVASLGPLSQQFDIMAAGDSPGWLVSIVLDSLTRMQ